MNDLSLTNGPDNQASKLEVLEAQILADRFALKLAEQYLRGHMSEPGAEKMVEAVVSKTLVAPVTIEIASTYAMFRRALDMWTKFADWLAGNAADEVTSNIRLIAALTGTRAALTSDAGRDLLDELREMEGPAMEAHLAHGMLDELGVPRKLDGDGLRLSLWGRIKHHMVPVRSSQRATNAA